MNRICAALFLVVSAAGAWGQTTSVNFANRVGTTLRAPVYGLEDPCRSGNTAAGVPAGVQVYSAPLLSGSAFTAALFAGPDAAPQEAMVLVASTAFGTGTSAGFYNGGVVPLPPFAPGQFVALQVRVWDNRGGSVPSWGAVLANPTVARGVSGVGLVQAAGQTIDLTFLRSYNLCAPDSASLDSNTLLLLRFDGGMNGAAGEAPTQATGVTYEPGVAGNGARFTNATQLFYGAAGNINATNGTLEFWLKPRWNGNDGQGHVILRWGDGGGMLFFKDGGNYWRSLANRYGAVGGKPEVGVGINISSEWRSNEWHYAAFTWNHESLKLYVDGQLRQQAAISGLPAVSSATFQIGADNTSSYLDSELDELRISDRERSAAEIEQSFLRNVIVTGLAIQPASTNLLVTWWHTPSLTATTAVGVLELPASAAAWTSSNPGVATVDAAGKVIARGAGTALVTASLNGASATLSVNVSAPARAAEVDAIDPALATPAPGALYDMPVMVINYIPTPDGVNVDPGILGGGTVAAFKAKLTTFNKRVKFMLEEGSRFRGYSNPTAPSLGYRIVHSVTAYEVMPPGRPAGGGAAFADFHQMLDRFGAGTLVSNRNVKEIWLWGYHTAGIVPPESNMSSPTTGDISNSNRDPTDLPIYDRTYVLYNYNSTRSQAEAVHDHGHQLESILSYVNQRQDGNTQLFWDKFCGRTNGVFLQGRCGNTHVPPNGASDYDYGNLTPVLSDCMDWTPNRTGQLASVNANTWGLLPYPWPGGNPPQQTESQYYIFWMQNMPGYANGIAHGTNGMRNWWEFTADWDNAIRENRGLYKPPLLAWMPGSTLVSNGFLTATLVMDPGFRYAIEESTDLTNWRTVWVATNTGTIYSINKLIEFAVPNGRWFCRARRLP